MKRGNLKSYYKALLDHFGPQDWWPAETPFEVMVGAVLTQNTAWSNVEKAIAALKAHGLLEARRIDRIDEGTLALAIRPAGYFNVKARRLKALVRWFVQRHGGRIERLRDVRPERLREELLEVDGVGPETADSILLYAVGAPRFVVDQYTRRMAARHGLSPEDASYEELQDLFESGLPRQADLYNEYHALIVAVGKDFCRPTPRCEECPLREFLPS